MFRFGFSVILSLFILSVSFAAEKIVFIDIQKVVVSSKAGISAQAELESQAKKFKEEIEKKQKAGESESQIRAFAEEKQKELMQKRQKIAEKFMKTLQKAISEFAKSKGYKLVLDKNSLLYGKPELDVTQDFLKYFDENYSTIK
ncbi:periplasmic chaperone for outer membrane proteins Skp [Persephonella hydrogeniphila]|uniref:Periplasmic chaperone for outer membrane proteins Skp n=1 Tax=Persephonella hydrogeniphila TaxID=198703 RepID=A0A285NQ23_9AQUI|nr:OmpH family outer membrane protein [Persephonella hydrogeniphila]SNZ11624.1 periplasmic chaperone for outer membrane proteins Skp [Persephonella hydrogeniphila]